MTLLHSRASGPIWDFRNASARKYYVDQVIGEVTSNETAALNMVFFDGGQTTHASPAVVSALETGQHRCLD